MQCYYNGRAATGNAFLLLSSIVPTSFLRHLVVKKETGLLEIIPDNLPEAQDNGGQIDTAKKEKIHSLGEEESLIDIDKFARQSEMTVKQNAYPVAENAL